MHPIRQNARVLTASLVGTAVEFFDFYIFGTAAALVFGPLFFPSESSAAQQLAAFMSFGLAFFARPLGAIAFGHFGDRVGRKATLVASLLLMGLSTVLIGVLPGYAAIGTAAPLLLCLLRFGQGFGLGGEWGGAALLAVENAPKGWEARFGAAPQMGAPPPAGRRPAPPKRKRSWLRIIAWTIGGLGALTAAGLVALVAFAPVGMMREQAVREIKVRTGRDLIILGRTSLSVFPSLAVTMADVSLSSPPGMASW